MVELFFLDGLFDYEHSIFFQSTSAITYANSLIEIIYDYK